jgi:hypothetical protein
MRNKRLSHTGSSFVICVMTAVELLKTFGL